MEEFSILIGDFVNGTGRFKGKELSRRQKRGYKKHKIVPFEFLEWLKECGLYDMAEDFMKRNRRDRTVSALKSRIEGDGPNFNYSIAVGRMLGNLRYQECDSRASPETIMNGMIDRLH